MELATCFEPIIHGKRKVSQNDALNVLEKGCGLSPMEAEAALIAARRSLKLSGCESVIVEQLLDIISAGVPDASSSASSLQLPCVAAAVRSVLLDRKERQDLAGPSAQAIIEQAELRKLLATGLCAKDVATVMEIVRQSLNANDVEDLTVDQLVAVFAVDKHTSSQQQKQHRSSSGKATGSGPSEPPSPAGSLPASPAGARPDIYRL